MSRLLVPLAACLLIVSALTACTANPDSMVGDAATATSDASPAQTTVAAVVTSPTTSTTADETTTSTSTTAPVAADIESLQLRLDSSDEVSPGILQGGYGITARIEWMGTSNGAAYDGEKCAAVITLTDPGGQIVETNRDSTCTGIARFDIWPSSTGTGTYTVAASLAPWEDADNPVESTLEFTILASGT